MGGDLEVADGVGTKEAAMKPAADAERRPQMDRQHLQRSGGSIQDDTPSGKPSGRSFEELLGRNPMPGEQAVTAGASRPPMAKGHMRVAARHGAPQRLLP